MEETGLLSMVLSLYMNELLKHLDEGKHPLYRISRHNFYNTKEEELDEYQNWT